MIVAFGDSATEDLFHGVNSAKARAFPRDIVKSALRKLDVVNAAAALSDLKVPPGNHLEAFSGDLAGHHSIRVNRQWRIVFRWDSGAHDVKLTDYH